MTIDRRAIGQQGEALAVDYLQAHGLQVIARNYRCRMGEIDIIATQTPDILIIAEVRLRSRRDYGGGAASVDWKKRSRILRTSRHLLMQQPQLAKLRVRFDVLDIQPDDGRHHIEWIRGAFDAH